MLGQDDFLHACRTVKFYGLGHIDEKCLAVHAASILGLLSCKTHFYAGSLAAGRFWSAEVCSRPALSTGVLGGCFFNISLVGFRSLKDCILKSLKSLSLTFLSEWNLMFY